MNKKGFTLIELLVVIVIIGILVAIALPNFIKIKDKAREAETKQNLHAVQLALERYAVDSPSSEYPLFLMTGDDSTNAQHGGYLQAGYLLPIPGFERKIELGTGERRRLLALLKKLAG